MFPESTQSQIEYFPQMTRHAFLLIDFLITNIDVLHTFVYQFFLELDGHTFPTYQKYHYSSE